MPLITQKTIQYQTWVKRSLVESLLRVFTGHVDELLRGTIVTIEYPTQKAGYPAIIVRFFERDILNAGVGHEEIIEINGLDFRFQHSYYTGDLEFAIHALSSGDRDLIADSLVQTLRYANLASYTNEFLEGIYDVDPTEKPQSNYNFININTDKVQGFGETTSPAPWGAEDAIIYQKSYRVGISGEFYSLPPHDTDAVGYIERIDQYPYLTDLEPVPTGNPADPTEWNPPFP